MDIVSAHGTIDHRNVFFSAHEKRASQPLCSCVSQVQVRYVYARSQLSIQPRKTETP